MLVGAHASEGPTWPPVVLLEIHLLCRVSRMSSFLSCSQPFELIASVNSQLKDGFKRQIFKDTPIGRNKLMPSWFLLKQSQTKMFLSFPWACLELGPEQSTELNPPESHLHASCLCSPVGGSCVRNCGPGFYGDPDMGECEPCHRACETCSGPGYTECSSCQAGLRLLHGTCVGPAQTQMEGKFWNGMCLLRDITGV